MGEDSPVFSPSTRSPPCRTSWPAAAASSSSARKRRTSTGAISTSSSLPLASASRSRHVFDYRARTTVCRLGSSGSRRTTWRTPASCIASTTSGSTGPGRVHGRTREPWCCARAPLPTRRGAGALAAAPYRRGRVVVAADSDLFGDDFLLRRDHRQLWLNLVYWVGAARIPGGRDGRSCPKRRRTLRGCASRTRPTPSGSCRSPRARSTSTRTTSARCGRSWSRWPRPSPTSRRASRTRRITSPKWSSTCDAWVEGGCGKPDFRASLDLFRPELGTGGRDRAPRRLPDVHAQRLARHALRGADHPDAVAGLRRQIERELYDNAKFVPVQLVDQDGGLRQRVRGALSRDRERRRTADQPLRRHLLRPRVLAIPALDAAGRRAPQDRHAAGRRWRSRRRRTSRSRPTSSGT